MIELKKININVNKLLQKYELQFTKEAKSKMADVYLLTTSFVCFILNEISDSKPFTKKDCDELLKILDS